MCVVAMSQILPEIGAPQKKKKKIWLRKPWGWHPETKGLWQTKKPFLKGQHPGQKQPVRSAQTSCARVLFANLEAQARGAGA